MRTVGTRHIELPSLLPSAEGLAQARVHQRTAAALAGHASTGIAKGIYRFASHAEHNAADEAALVRVIGANAAARVASGDASSGT